MENHLENKTPALRYALLDELRGLDLISMMLYHACWDLIFLFGMRADWYYDTPGRLWQQSICWVFILLSGFCVPLGHRTLRRGAVVFGGGALVTTVTLLFMPGDRVIFGVLTLLGSAMMLTALVRPVLDRIPPVVGIGVSAVLFAFTRQIMYGWVGFGSWLISASVAVCQLFYRLFWLYALVVLFHRLFPADALDLFVLGGLFPASPDGKATHGTPAPLGLSASGLDGAAFFAALPSASAGDLRGAVSGFPHFVRETP